MKFCPVCGKSNSPESRVCELCGTPLAASKAGQASSNGNSPQAPVSGPLCPVCRRGNREGSAFCAHCGFRLQPAVPAGANQAMPHIAAPMPAQQIEVAADVTGNLPTGMVLKRRYRIMRKIAQGGMGAVYESSDLTAATGTRWAVKEISPAALPSGERLQAIADFRREAQMLARLHHPNLPQVVETFEEMSKHFLVMEFIPGRTLLNVLDNTQSFLPEDQIMVWARQLLEVMHYLHSQDPPIIYRDLKPANIMLVEGTERIKLIDFGIARFHRVGKMRDTEAFGTAGYAPPEQYGKGQTDERSDVYALAATLHHLVTRHDPSANPFNWLPVRRYNKGISVRLESALQQALSLDPARRYSGISSFAQALGISLSDIETGRPVVADVPQQIPVPPPAPRSKNGASGTSAPPMFVPALPTSHDEPTLRSSLPVEKRAVAVHTPTEAFPAPIYTPPPTPVPKKTKEARPPKSGGALVVSDRLVDFGESRWNVRPVRRIQVRSASGGQVDGTVVASQPWIAFNPKQFQEPAITLEVRVRKAGLRFGRAELHVPNLFAMIWSRTRRVLPVIGCWFWVLFLAASSLGKMLLWGLAGAVALVFVAEALLWVLARHVHALVPAEQLNTGRLVVRSSGSEQQVEVRVVARPSWARRAIGWSAAVLMLAAEVAAAVWIGLTLGGVRLTLPGL